MVVLHLGWCNPGCIYELGDKRLQCSPEQGGVGVLVDGELNMSSIFKKQKQENMHLNLMQKTPI